MKLPYKNVAWDYGLKTKREQELFFEISNNAERKIYGDYPNHLEIVKVLMALINHNVHLHFAGAVLTSEVKRK